MSSVVRTVSRQILLQRTYTPGCLLILADVHYVVVIFFSLHLKIRIIIKKKKKIEQAADVAFELTEGCAWQESS